MYSPGRPGVSICGSLITWWYHTINRWYHTREARPSPGKVDFMAMGLKVLKTYKRHSGSPCMMWMATYIQTSNSCVPPVGPTQRATVACQVRARRRSSWGSPFVHITCMKASPSTCGLRL